MKKFILGAIAALALVGIASAQSQGYYLENAGRIQNTLQAYASVQGAGGSLSHAEGSAQAIANGVVAQLPGSVAVVGDVSGFNRAVAYNTSFGAGQGMASSVGWSDATVSGWSTAVIPSGYVSVNGVVDGGMQNPVRNGTDVHVIAGTAQDGFVNTSYAGGFAVTGNVTATPIPGGWRLTGNVQDTKYADGQVMAGGVTFAGGTPAGQTAADRGGNTGVVVNVNGAFDDPVH